MKKIITYICCTIAFLLTSCYTTSSRTLYPPSLATPTFKVGQKYSSKVELSHFRNLLSEWMAFNKESPERKKIPKGTIFEVTKVNKKFSGTFGRSLEVWVKFKMNGEEHFAFLASRGLGKRIFNVEGYNVYLVPDPSKATLVR